MKKQPICAVLAALLLTACSSEPLVNTDAEPDITAQSGTAEGSGTVPHPEAQGRPQQPGTVPHPDRKGTFRSPGSGLPGGPGE